MTLCTFSTVCDRWRETARFTALLWPGQANPMGPWSQDQMKPGPSGGGAMPGVPESSGHSPAMRAQQASMLSTGPCRQMGTAVWACPSRRHTSLLAVWPGRPFPGCSTADLALVKAKRHQDALGSPGVGLCPSPIVEDTQRPLQLCRGLPAPHTVCMLSTVQVLQRSCFNGQALCQTRAW